MDASGQTIYWKRSVSFIDSEEKMNSEWIIFAEEDEGESEGEDGGAAAGTTTGGRGGGSGIDDAAED